MKKIAILFFILLVVPMYAANSYHPSTDEVLTMNTTAYNENISKSKEILLEIENSLVNDYSEIYAGEFIDAEGHLYLCFTEMSFKKNNRLELDEDIVRYEYKKHSLKSLYQAYDALGNSIIKLNIAKIALSIQENCIIVHTNPMNQELIIDFLGQEITNFSKDIIQFKETEKVELTGTKVLGGVEIFHRTALIIKNTGTVGFNAYHIPTKQYGVVTNAHVAPVGKVMFDAKSKPIGTSQNQAFDNNVDCAFVPFDYQNGIDYEKTELINQGTFNKAIKRTALISEFIEGERTSKMGKSSGLNYGTLKYKAVDAVIDGRHFYDIFECTNAVKNGDSGGPIGIHEINGQYILLGITFAKNSNNQTYGCKIPAILLVLDLIPVTIDTKNILP